MRHITDGLLTTRSLRFFMPSHVAVGLGIAAATAVIVGALIVGDSVRGSLRSIVLDRLGNVECLLHSRTYFDPQILAVPKTPSSDAASAKVVPAILLPSSTIEYRQADQVQRASRVQVLGVSDEFWLAAANEFSSGNAAIKLAEDEVALNQSLADELSVEIGAEITLRIRDTPGVPADNPLGRRDDVAVSLPRQKVVHILPDESLGGIQFRAGQAASKNVFCNLATLQDVLECESSVNAALVLNNRSSNGADETGQAWCDELNLQLRPAIEDYGLRLERHRRIFPDSQLGDAAVANAADGATDAAQPSQVVYDYYQLSSQELVIDEDTMWAVLAKLGMENVTRSNIYLANSIAKVSKPDVREMPFGRTGFQTIGRLRDGQIARSQFVRNVPQAATAEAAAAESAGRRTPRVTEAAAVLDFPAPMPSEPRVYAELLSRRVPYSIIAGMDHNSSLSLFSFNEVPDDQLNVQFCWINSWLAAEVDAEPGDWLELQYFEPETVDGREILQTQWFMVAGVVPFTEPAESYRGRRPASFEQSPTAFNDPNITPTVPGMTDQASISNWDVPFPLDNDLILEQDDTYYENHRLTPKLFLPYEVAASPQFFGSRFGQTTAIRIQADKVADQDKLRSDIEEALLSTRAVKGLAFLPIRQQQLQAASGTTPFDLLFLSLSFFVIVAALLLVMLLIRLGIEKRSTQIGVLYAQGFSPGRVRGLLLREYAVVALGGAVVGVVLGIGYARVMIAGLESWWVGAISAPFLDFSFTWMSLAIGLAAGFLASLSTIYVALRKTSRMQPLALLRGRTDEQDSIRHKINRFALAIAGFAAFGALGLMMLGFGQTGMARAGTFFGCGLLVLAASLLGLREWIAIGGRTSAKGKPPAGGLPKLAWRAISRNPIRSSLSLGLLSVASFLIASMGVFQIAPDTRGYGGFNLIAESSQPIYRNIGTASVRSEMIGDAAKPLLDSLIIPMRMRPGEDASCNNLFQVAQPTILAVPPSLETAAEFASEEQQFRWAAKETDNPWQAVNAGGDGTREKPIPVIIDQNTAAWSLKQGASLNAIVELEYNDQPLFFRTVGLLSNSVLQGKLLIGQDNFEDAFPEINGTSFFLIRTADDKAEETVRTLEDGWSDAGFDVSYSRVVLQKMLGVQNTYITAFQSLGALGLLLGTFGLIAVQLRSVIERRQELALMQAVGFPQSRISQMLTLETAILLFGGLLLGVLAAAISLAPFVFETGPKLSLLGPTSMLAAVLVVGFIAALIAVRAANRHSVLEGLRSE